MLRIATTDGVELAVHDLGGTGLPLLLAHATGFHGRVFEPLARHLAGHYHCWAPDQRGHGVSTAPEGTSFDWNLFGDDIGVVAARLDRGGQPLFGVGHSMGGAALLMAEARRPGTFAAVYLYEPIVIPPGFDGPAPGSNPLAEGAMRRRQEFESKEAALANYAEKPPLDSLDADALRAYVDHGFEPLPDGRVRLRCPGEVEATIFRMAATQRVWDGLGDVRCPVVVASGRPEPGPSTFAPLLAEALPHGRLERYVDLGHFGPIEDPARIATAILTAFSSNSTQ